MPNPEHLAKLMEGVEAWNQWRGSNRSIMPDLGGAFLRDAILNMANLSDANLVRANLVSAYLNTANLRNANLTGANLSEARLQGASLLGTNLEGAELSGCTVYGISVWNVRLEGAIQSNLVITPADESVIQVDSLEVAQFVYLLLDNQRIRHVIDTIGKKAVLILGRFGERKPVLEKIRTELRTQGYLPIVFDFERPTDRDFTETVLTLAGMSRFIIADMTRPKSVPLESQVVVPNYMIPMVPIIQKGEEPFSMF